jgi:hypothetical protein
MIIGRVLGINVDEKVIEDGRLSMPKLRLLCRLGFGDYSVIEKIITIPKK